MQFYIERSNKIKDDINRFRPSTGEIDAINSEHELSNAGSEFSFSSPSSAAPIQSHRTTSEDPVEGEDARRRFYSLCLRKKMNMYSNNPYKTVSIANLYSTLLARNISEEKWEDHIDRELGLQ